MQLRFVASESTGSYFEALQGELATHGCPVAFHSDRQSYRVLRHDYPVSSKRHPILHAQRRISQPRYRTQEASFA